MRLPSSPLLVLWVASLACSEPAPRPRGEREIDAGALPAGDAAPADAGAADGAEGRDAEEPVGPALDGSLDGGVLAEAGVASEAGVLGPDGGGGAADAAARADAGVPFVPGVGFAASATRWSVPPSGRADGFFASAYTLGARGWLVVDLDGDGLSDLVQTADIQNGAGVVWTDLQGPYWRLFKGSGRGFAATAERWSVPSSGLSDGFFAAYYGDDARHWGLFDLDADGRPELVQTADPARSGGFVYSDVQGAYWKVWSSTSIGFTGSARRFAVPSSGLADGFFSTSYCADVRCWSLLDLDGDAYPDLVQTADPARPGGQVYSDANGPRWSLWRGSASGLGASPDRYGVPASGLADGFFAASYASAPPGTRFWATLDLDGDGRRDLVQTADPAQSGGFVWRDGQGPSWRVFLGGASAFGAGLRVGVPESGLSDGFFATSYLSTPSFGGDRGWLTLDLDGDRRPELVQTADSARSGGFVYADVQGAYWRVWRLGAQGATGPVRWSVPPSGLTDGFYAGFWLDSANGSRAWSLRDLDGDGRIDLVQTADPAQSGLVVFSDAQGAYWKVYRGQ